MKLEPKLQAEKIIKAHSGDRFHSLITVNEIIDSTKDFFFNMRSVGKHTYWEEVKEEIINFNI